MRTIGFVIALLLILPSGCATDRPESAHDLLWQQGYGFNNPNRDRIRNGEKPLNFDGSEADR